MTPTVSCFATRPHPRPAELPVPAAYRSIYRQARLPWTLRVDRGPLRIRPAGPRDLGALGAMHRRCSPSTLLDRYHLGGKMPSPAELDRQVRLELSFLAEDWRGDVVAFVSAEPDLDHHSRSARGSAVVADAWQRMGIGTELVAHLAGAALVSGYLEIVGYPGTDVSGVRRLMNQVGRTRVVSADTTHLHTALPESASLSVGSLKERLVG